MIEALIRAQTEEERTLEFIRFAFLLIALFGFAFYSMEHWVLGHFAESWQSRIPFYVSLVGFPLTALMFWHRGRWVRYPWMLWMGVTFLTGVLGAYYHLLWNARDAEVSLWTLSGFLEAFKGSRPVLAALAHTHIGAVALVVGFTIKD
ncbi:HAD family hydrolase [Thermus filiformis]|uniref:Uncharacterized protein n=1 Tax=Thermus filiformis TaxID=276 RepID=A0A0A2WQ22_THEFI|nr:hypothetical protein [Thermus filiformis]KGQ22246.1 hypothetical protein THFILI_05655 [Thermus filiformis]